MLNEVNIGEAFIGIDGKGNFNAAHTNVIFGSNEGAVGQALANAMASPRQGYIPFMAIHKPNVPVKPATLFVAKAEIANEFHGNATWGAAQAGVARGVQDAIEQGIVTQDMQNRWCLIACIWVNPSVNDLDAIYRNNREAICLALDRSLKNKPSSDEIKEVQASASNPFYTPYCGNCQACEREDFDLCYNRDDTVQYKL